MIQAIIIENDPQHAADLSEKLQHTKKQVQVLSVCANIDDAVAAIRKLKPELLFLDIALDNGDNGFDLLRKFEKPDFSVIFTTQYNNTSNAISALRACALDFLAKPLLANELEDALERYDKTIGIEQTQILKKNMEAENGQVQAILIAGTDGKTRIETENILYCESSNVYTNFYLLSPVNKKNHYTSSLSIKEWERSLCHSTISRVHNEFLVNFRHIDKYSSKFSGSAELILKSGITIPVSKSRKNGVKELLKLHRKN